MNFYDKYLKYKKKYLNLQKLKGGNPIVLFGGISILLLMVGYLFYKPGSDQIVYDKDFYANYDHENINNLILELLRIPPQWKLVVNYLIKRTPIDIILIINELESKYPDYYKELLENIKTLNSEELQIINKPLTDKMLILKKSYPNLLKDIEDPKKIVYNFIRSNNYTFDNFINTLLQMNTEEEALVLCYIIKHQYPNIYNSIVASKNQLSKDQMFNYYNLLIKNKSDLIVTKKSNNEKLLRSFSNSITEAKYMALINNPDFSELFNFSA